MLLGFSKALSLIPQADLQIALLGLCSKNHLNLGSVSAGGVFASTYGG